MAIAPTSLNVNITGPFVDVGSTIISQIFVDEGSAFRIGDGYWMSASHVLMEFNREYSDYGDSALIYLYRDYGITVGLR